MIALHFASESTGKRNKPQEIVAKLRQVEVLQGHGQLIADAVRQIGVTQQTFYRWRKQYGGMSRAWLRGRENVHGKFWGEVRHRGQI